MVLPTQGLFQKSNVSNARTPICEMFLIKGGCFNLRSSINSIKRQGGSSLIQGRFVSNTREVCLYYKGSLSLIQGKFQE